MIAVLKTKYRNKNAYPLVKNLLGFYFLQVDKEELPFCESEISHFETI